MVDRKKMGKQNRDKGARYERKVRDIFNGIWPPFKAYRSAQRKGNRNAADISFDESSPAHGHLHVECKFVKKLNVRAAYETALAEASPEQEVILAIGAPRRRDLAVVDLDWLLVLLAEGYQSAQDSE